MNIQKYPGLRIMFTYPGFTVESQDRYPLRTAINMRGEETLNKHTRTSDIVKQSSFISFCLDINKDILVNISIGICLLQYVAGEGLN